MALVLSKTVKCTYSNSSLLFAVPSFIARAAQLSPSSRFYVYVEDTRVVYSPIPPPPGVRRRLIKIRVQVRSGSRTYYAFVIPRFAARALGIQRGDSLLVTFDGVRILVSKI